MSISRTLAGICSDGITSAWNAYVTNRKGWSTTEYEIDKDIPAIRNLTTDADKFGKEFPSGTKLKILDTTIYRRRVEKKLGDSRNTVDVECAKVQIGNEKGYLPIRVIKKPRQTAARVSAGAIAQTRIVPALQNLNNILVAEDEGKDFGTVTLVSSAVAGSTKTDVLIEVNGKRMGIEVKNQKRLNNGYAEVSMYDKTYTRGKVTGNDALRNEAIDKYMGYFPPERFKSEDGVLRTTFEQIIDGIRDGKIQLKKRSETESYIDPMRYGFIGDPGVTTKGGGIPGNFWTDDFDALEKVRDNILQKLQTPSSENYRDDYFTVVQGENIYMYYTGKIDNKQNNPLGMPPLPDLDSFYLSTYGGFRAKQGDNEATNLPGRGKMRVKVVVKFKLLASDRIKQASS